MSERTVSRPAPGSASMVDFSNCVWARELFTSTTGASPDTVTVSSSAPTARSALTVAANSAGRLSPSRFSVRKPGSVKVTV